MAGQFGNMSNMNDKLFIVECASKCMADFINEKNRGVNFSWMRWYNISKNRVKEQCMLQQYEYDEQFLNEYLNELMRRIGN